ncbi:MAG TPA: VWA domain-containing protein, partial [Gemmatimonadaceae bacterium]|nr:VWA domain-containing protein [Gemmatimonadaceae bacterium]
YGMLRARIFPIAPGEEKKVVVRFQAVAEREGDAVRVDYFQGKSSWGDLVRRASAGRDEPTAGSFTLTYPGSEGYGNAYSPTHSLRTTRRGERREVRAIGNASEITLLVPVQRSNKPSISVLTYAPRDENGFALITMSPPAVSATGVTPRDITLVLDVSGSMSGAKIRQAKAAGKQLLETLTPADRFRLIDFSTDVRTFRDEFVRATSENIREGMRYLESLDASGSTNISGALELALEGAQPAGRLGLVLFLTDGEPTVGERNPEAIASHVARLRKNRRIFSFGIGAELNAALVERLAVEGKGTAHFVRPDESVERAVSIVASRLTNPVITDVRVRADGVRLLKLHPSEATDVFAGQDYVLLARYSGSGDSRLRFEGETTSGPVSWSTRAVFPSSSRENSFVARLWATQRVGFLSAERRKNGGSREIDDEIRQLGETFAIPTEFTSYLVLEPGMQPQRRMANGRANGASLHDVVVTGVATAAATAAAPPPAVAQSTAFEAARDAAKQRAATNLTVADESDSRNEGSTPTRRVGHRSFTLSGGKWIDSRHATSVKVVKIRPFSEAWFSLIEAIPELRDVFALGDRVLVVGRGAAIETGTDGRETLSETDLRAIQSRW